MRVAIVLVVVACAAVAGAILFRSRTAEGVSGPSAPSAPGPASGEAAPGAAVAQGPDPGARGIAGPASEPLPAEPFRETAPKSHDAVARIQELRQEIERLRMARADADASAIRKVLEELARLGPEGVGVVLELMEDETFDFAGRASTMGDVLAPIDDPRIVVSARRVFDRNVVAGLDSWYTTWGYLRLVGKGGPEDADWLLGLTGKPGQMATGAAKGLAYLPPGSRPLDAVLERIRTDELGMVSRDLCAAVTAWKDPGARRALQDLAMRDTLGEHARDAAFAALAQSCEDAPAARIHVAAYATSRDAAVRAAVVRSLSSLDRPPLAAAAPAIAETARAALADPEWPVRLAAVSTIGNHRKFHSSEILASLEGLLPSASDDQRASIDAAAAKVRRSLATR